MTHDKLFSSGAISRSEYRELVKLKEHGDNPHFTNEARREAKRLYREKEEYYRAREKENEMIRRMEKRP